MELTDVLNWVFAQAVPIAVLLLVGVGLGVVVTVANNYHKVAPNEVAVVSGRGRKSGTERVGYRVVQGGGFFLIPVLERVDYLSLNLMTFQLEVINAPDKNGAPVTVRAIANVKILGTAEALPLAIERFLGNKMEQVQGYAKENLESNLRAIVGTMTIEELIKDRAQLQGNVTKEAVQDLAKLGLGCDLLNIQEVKDDKGYINALGQTVTAGVMRDAAIGRAEADQETKVKSAAAQRIGDIAQAEATQAISDANRARDIRVAENDAQTIAAQARIEIAGQVAAANETGKLNSARVAAEMVRVEKETELQGLELRRKDAELKATVVISAERAKDATIIQAEAQAESAVMIGEADRVRLEKAGQGQQAQLIAQAIGRKAVAEAVQAEREAEAAGELAMLSARATGTRAQLSAEAEGVRLKGLAEAEASLKKVEALNELDDNARILFFLEASPKAIATAGQALAAVASPFAEAIGQGLANIGEVRMVDLGGGNRNGSGSLVGDFAKIPVETAMAFVEKANAAGLGPLLIQALGKVGLTLPAMTASAETKGGKPNGAAAS